MSSQHSNKRKRSDDVEVQKKKKRVDTIDPQEWVAATNTYSYMLDDGYLDYCKYKRGSFRGLQLKKNTFMEKLMSQAKIFETHIINKIVFIFGRSQVKFIYADFDPTSTLAYEKTLSEMKKGTPFIYQGVVRDYKRKIYGVPDLLVRSDYFPQWIASNPIPLDEVDISAPTLDDGYHYRVVDIKYTTLALLKDGNSVSDSRNFRAYKVQLGVYNQCLGVMQGYTPPAAYLCGRRWSFKSKGNLTVGKEPFQRLGIIDYQDVDFEYIERGNKAIEWVKSIRNNINKWDLSTLPLPSRKLYPNMCNKQDYPYSEEKKAFAEEIGEITLIWYCGIKERNYAHEQGIYSWKDPKCTAKNMGIVNPKKSKIINKILQVNRSNENFYPKTITNNLYDWQTIKPIEFFVDFETTTEVLCSLDQHQESHLFMIGCTYRVNEKTKHKTFIAKSLDNTGEYQTMVEFINFVKDKCIEYEVQEPKIYHWYSAEPTIWNRLIKKYESNLSSLNFDWTDLLLIFKAEPIIVRGALNFGLKSIAKAMHSHGFIDSIWDSGATGAKCENGLDAAVEALIISEQAKLTNQYFSNHPRLAQIVHYNQIDCQVLAEILSFLRSRISPNPSMDDFSDEEEDEEQEEEDEEKEEKEFSEEEEEDSDYVYESEDDEY